MSRDRTRSEGLWDRAERGYQSGTGNPVFHAALHLVLGGFARAHTFGVVGDRVLVPGNRVPHPERARDTCRPTSEATAMSSPSYLTTGDICARFHAPPHGVRYAIQSRRIEPAQVAGQYRLFDQPAVDAIGKALSDIAANPAPVRPTL